MTVAEGLHTDAVLKRRERRLSVRDVQEMGCKTSAYYGQQLAQILGIASTGMFAQAGKELLDAGVLKRGTDVHIFPSPKLGRILAIYYSPDGFEIVLRALVRKFEEKSHETASGNNANQLKHIEYARKLIAYLQPKPPEPYSNGDTHGS